MPLSGCNDQTTLLGRRFCLSPYRPGTFQGDRPEMHAKLARCSASQRLEESQRCLTTPPATADCPPARIGQSHKSSTDAHKWPTFREVTLRPLSACNMDKMWMYDTQYQHPDSIEWGHRARYCIGRCWRNCPVMAWWGKSRSCGTSTRAGRVARSGDEKIPTTLKK